ncbi:hypothetical protein EDB85DRAFT_2152165 [Lactarius pseudohatsudake]|nr:hypothetical protein EDB85DRAFT_2152165 [Lactarius pseudohatsudake]
MDDQLRFVEQLPLGHRPTDSQTEIFIERDIVKRRPTSDLKLIFKDDVAVT